MTADEFAKAFYLERKATLDTYFSNQDTEISKLIKSMELNEKNNERLRQIISGVLRDNMYSILLGLDGSSQIGGHQEKYKLTDEKGNELTGGEIEASAWEYFHNHRYEQQNSKADFIAELTFRSTEEGGRRTPARSGYRPQVKFIFDDMQTSGEQTYIDRDWVFPGDSVTATIRIIAVEHFQNKLTSGLTFEFREASTVIGTGRILHILNPKLKR